MRPYVAVLAGVCAAFVPAIGDEYLWPSEVLALPPEFSSTGGVVSVRGVVTFTSGLEYGRFVVAPEEHPNQRGVEVVSKSPCEDLTCGAVVLVSGAAVERDGAVSIDADTVDILRVERLAPPPVAKQSDYRKGLLDGRVVTLNGTVCPYADRDVDFGAKAVATCSGDLSDNVVATSRVRRTWMGRALGILRR